jgi:hypothetical protein
VLYFGDRTNEDTFFDKVDFLAEVSASNVVCVRVPKPAELKAPEPPIVPPARLDATDLWAAYGVKDADTIVLADRYGNPFVTTTEPVLNEKLAELAAHFKDARKSLQKEIDAAKAARDTGDVGAAFTALKAGFKLGLTGYKEAKEAGKLYNEMIETGREKLKQAGKDAKVLEELAKQYEGTDLSGDIEAARKSTN